jgi:uncharacterized protein (DUF2147 family)
MKKVLCPCVLLLALFITASLYAAGAGPDAVTGKWWNQEKTSQIEIFKQEGKYVGRIIWLKVPLYPGDDPKGMAGKPKIDRENPDHAKRDRPLLGMVMVWGFTPEGENLWENGFIYDPRNGKTYKCKMTLKSDDVLDVRGFIGVSLFGKTNTWTRVK